ncbi:unnamed protein product [Arabidopsis thaliana]|uniref:Peroxin-13 n=1 Tax=Arabidopsis thaliana TaxID=3702 RepID=A0A7G2EKS1_ARATH|nr:unnamed protein product [Arabidopsis thaliana]
MASQPAGGSPPKPWEKEGNTSGPNPFRPPSNTSTAGSVEASGTANPGEVVPPPVNRPNTAANMNSLSRPVPARPWEQQNYGSTMGGGYGSNLGMYGGGAMGGYGGTMGGYGMGMGTGMGMGMGMGMGGPYGSQDPNDPFNQPPSPPGFWISFLRVMQGAVNFFGRVAMLIDQNTQAFHMFMSALLQLFDRGGMLYGELARFVLRMLGVRTRPRKMQQPPQGPNGLPLPHQPHGNQNYLEGPKTAAPGGGGGWDNVWGN